jgi:hypothetical protein
MVEEAIREDAFRLVFVVEHQEGDVHFVWHGVIDGSAEGMLTFTMEGEAKTTFHRNRIGFCLLYPANLAGMPCTLEHTDGGREEATFPYLIDPDQPVLPFANLRTISQTLSDGTEVSVRMEGDTFEMEDQRNWTDASFKTFCTPLALPYPVEVAVGTRVSQKITLKLDAPNASADTLFVGVEEGLLRLYQPADPVMLPDLGVIAVSEWSEAEQQRLAQMHLGHLRVDVRFDRGNWRDSLRSVSRLAWEINLWLEVALYLPPEPGENEALLAALAEVVEETQSPIRAWLVYYTKEVYQGQAWFPVPVGRLREIAPNAKIGTGSDTDFIFFNRLQGKPVGADFVTVQVNPQTHAFDNASLVETLTVQGVLVESAREKSGCPVGISPVTLKARSNSYATVPHPPPIPPDPRQATLFSAVWTLGCLRSLTEAGVVRVTLYEMSGLAGVQNSLGVYPLYFVLAWVGEKHGEPTYPLQTAHPLQVTGLRVGNRVLLGNLSNETVSVVVPTAAPHPTVKFLDQRTAIAACSTPEVFLRMPGQEITPTKGELHLNLLPYATVCVEEDT